MYLSNPRINICVNALRCGDVIAYPTEAVWGLGCDPFNSHAVEKVLALKNRHWSKGLILVAGDISQLDFLLGELSGEQKQKLNETWPGHVTWLVPHHGKVSPLVCGEHDTIALRVSTHPLIKSLCHKFAGPIVSTSANPQGLPPARTSFDANRYFKKRGVLFSPGVVGKSQAPSKIIDLRSGNIIR